MRMMKSQILTSSLLLISVLCFNCTLHAEELSHLKLVRKYVLDTNSYPQRMDLSGLTSDGKYLYAISDLSDQNDIFRIELKPKPALVKVMQLDSNWLNEWYSENSESGRYDTEGIAYCNGKFYLAEESTRTVLEVRIGGDFYRPIGIKPDWSSFHAKKVLDESFFGYQKCGFRGDRMSFRKRFVIYF